jgi:hypothetical protein
MALANKEMVSASVIRITLVKTVKNVRMSNLRTQTALATILQMLPHQNTFKSLTQIGDNKFTLTIHELNQNFLKNASLQTTRKLLIRLNYILSL